MKNAVKSFKSAALNTPVEARTENGMKALESSLSANVDLFFKIGASRGKDITVAFEKAYQEDAETAIRIALWARDARSGAGERQIFRDILKHLNTYHANDVTFNLLAKVPELGRWDDLLELPIEQSLPLIKKGLSEKNGLCAKWMPRKGPIAVGLRKQLGLTPKAYRKLLVSLTNVVETAMCSKNWDSIDFNKVPSLAMARYNKTFYKNALESYTQYKAKLVKGEAKINAAAVYPYDIVKTIKAGGDKVVADEQWKALPNYMTDANVLPMVDVSGSMMAGLPSNPNIQILDIAVSLGLYCADKNLGSFKDLFLTFSENSEMVHLKGTLSQKITQMETSRWGMNTNLHKAFELILKIAKNNDVPQEQMPSALLILSDMQFDQCVDFDDSAFYMMKRKYESAGYKMPGIVFWNLRDAGNTPVKFDEKGTALVSGFSPAIMKSVLGADYANMTPENIMKQTVFIDRYNFK